MAVGYVYNLVHIYVQDGAAMKMTSFSDFRKHAAALLDEVEKGETVRIMRHGRPVADLTPIASAAQPSWKKNPPRIELKGASLARAILENRKASDK
jgi:prevent-host-death family protein